MLPFTWLGIDSSIVGSIGAFLVWLILATTLGWVPGMWAYALTRIRDYDRAVQIVVAVLLLPILEWTRACFFSIFAWSPGTGINAHFSLGATGYGLSWSPGLLWAAMIGGAWVLSALCALTSISLVFAHRSLGMRRLMWGVVPFLMVVVGYVAPPAAQVAIGQEYADVRGVTFALVHESFTPTLTWDVQRQREREKELAEKFLTAAAHAEVIVFPEDTRFFSALHLVDAPLRERVERALRSGTYTIESARVENTTHAREVITVRQGRVMVLESEKALLAPFGEYVPLSAWILIGSLGFSDSLARLAESRASYVPGDFDPYDRVVSVAGIRIGVTVCSETFSPAMYRAIRKAGADVFINLASHAWIQDGRPLLFNQMRAMAQVHAVAAGIPYIQASAGAPTVVIYPNR